MSKGSPIVPVRIPIDLLEAIDREIGAVNVRRTKEPYYRSSFILDAVREKLDKYARGRKKRVVSDSNFVQPETENETDQEQKET